MVANKFCNKQQGDNMKSKNVRENHSTKVRKPTRITWEKFQESVVGLDSSEAAVIMNVSWCDEDKEVLYDIDLKVLKGLIYLCPAV